MLSDGRVEMQVCSSLFETVLQVSNFLGFSPVMLIWSLIVLKLWLNCRKYSQKRMLDSLWKEQPFWLPKCEKQFGRKNSEVSSFQPAQTERTANVVVDYGQVHFSLSWMEFTIVKTCMLQFSKQRHLFAKA